MSRFNIATLALSTFMLGGIAGTLIEQYKARRRGKGITHIYRTSMDPDTLRQILTEIWL